MTTSIRIAATLALAVLALLNFALARQSLTSALLRAPGGATFQETVLPDADLLRAGFLNYDQFAADVAWIAVNTNVGAARQRHQRLAKIEENAETIRALDRHQLRLYEWFPAVWTFSHPMPTYEEVEVATRFVEKGMEVYPHNTELPFSAAMSYIGLRDADSDAKIRRYERIIGLLEESLEGDDVHPMNPLVLSYHRRKLHQFRAGEELPAAEQIEMLQALYLRSTDPVVKRSIAEQLQALGGADEHLSETMRHDREFEREHNERLPYVSPSLFTFLGETI